jgi:riboflavin kinase/FMN adenylyltransferase
MALPTFTLTQLRSAAPGLDTALTIGVFDGVHRGHQALVRRVQVEAQARSLSPGVVTLHPHPITVLRPDIRPSYLTTLDDRIELLRAAGADWVLPLTFTSEVAEISTEELAEAFHREMRMRLMVLGPDAAFGRGAPKDTYERMVALGARLGFEVIRIEPRLDDAGQRYSSTAIRKALAVGEMEQVTEGLGRAYRLSGPVVLGFQRGRTIGFPTANISVAADRALPALGVYATLAHVGGRAYAGATNIGTRPTFDAGHISIETYLHDFAGDIYGQRLDLDLIHRIRDEVAFANVDDLVAQIRKDAEEARTRITSAGLLTGAAS